MTDYNLAIVINLLIFAYVLIWFMLNFPLNRGVDCVTAIIYPRTGQGILWGINIITIVYNRWIDAGELARCGYISSVRISTLVLHLRLGGLSFLWRCWWQKWLWQTRWRITISLISTWMLIFIVVHHWVRRLNCFWRVLKCRGALKKMLFYIYRVWEWSICVGTAFFVFAKDSISFDHKTVENL